MVVSVVFFHLRSISNICTRNKSTSIQQYSNKRCLGLTLAIGACPSFGQTGKIDPKYEKKAWKGPLIKWATREPVWHLWANSAIGCPRLVRWPNIGGTAFHVHEAWPKCFPKIHVTSVGQARAGTQPVQLRLNFRR